MRLQILGLVVMTGVGLTACSSGGSTGSTGFIPSGNAGTTGAAGTSAAGTIGSQGTAGSTSPAGTAGTTGTAGSTPSAGTTGTAGVAGGTAGTGTAGSAPDGGTTTGTAGSGVTGDITKVRPSDGCGMAPPAGLNPGTLVKQTIMTAGTKDANCADSKCGAWTDTREYWVKLPTGYDKTKAYPLFFEGPGCGGAGNNLYNIAEFDSTVIRVGLTPSAYWQQYHATNPGQHCFDDKEGDDSVDWVLYEKLYDLFNSTLCFDRNRVFAGGNSSGAWFSNELGCKYAGDPTRPVRAIMPNTGGLPTDPKYVPTCTTKPMAGFWSHQVGDTENPFSGNIVAMNRALQVAGCTSGGATETYANGGALGDPFTLTNGNATQCKRYKGCPDTTPLVVCPLPGNNHDSNTNTVQPGWAAFVKLFSTGSLISQ
jgi:poly(3-hydroxybutyrate) depolymerase